MPDFGIFRGFNDKLFGDKLYAGQLPTQLGIIGSQEVFDIDPDAQAFFDRVTAAGGTLSATEKTATNQLVLDLKANSLWTPMKAIYPMVGASAAACAQNLKSSSFTGTFTATGWTFASTGMKPNGTSAFMNTNYNASASGSLNSAHISIYSRTDTFNSGEDMGNYGNFAQQLGYRYGISDNYLAFNSIEYLAPIFTPTTGLLTFTRISSSTAKVFHKNNSPYVDNRVSTGILNLSLYIGALNRLNLPFLYSNKEFAFASIGDGLSDQNAADLNTVVNTFQTTLSRNV
jgi:hypothetical protein